MSEEPAQAKETEKLTGDALTIAFLKANLEELRTGGIITVAMTNPNVMSYMGHWEGRTEKAEARLSEAVKVLEPFAKCSEVYPLADGERDAGFAGLHDSRCPLKIEDYHAARQFIDTIKGDK